MLYRTLDGKENIVESNLNPLDFSFLKFDEQLKVIEVSGLINGLMKVISIVQEFAETNHVYDLNSASECVLATHYEGVENAWGRSVEVLFGIYFPPNYCAIDMCISNPYVRNVAYLFAKHSPAFKCKKVTKEDWLEQANNVLVVLIEELERAKNRTPLGKLKLLFHKIVAYLKR